MADAVAMSVSPSADAASPAGRGAAPETPPAADAGAAKPAGFVPSKPAGTSSPKPSPAAKPPLTARSSFVAKAAAASAVPAPRRGGWLFSVVCAVLSLAGAAVALTAPVLRPQAFDLARQWFGDDSAALRYLAPSAGEPATARR